MVRLDSIVHMINANEEKAMALLNKADYAYEVGFNDEGLGWENEADIFYVIAESLMNIYGYLILPHEN